MVIALAIAYFLPVIAFSCSCYFIDTIVLNLKSEIINIKSKNFNTINLSTIILTISLSFRLYIILFPDSLNSKLRPLAYPLLDILSSFSLIFIVICIIQIFTYFREIGFKKTIINILLSVTLGITLAPIFFIILKSIKKIIPNEVLLIIVDVLEVIRNIF